MKPVYLAVAFTLLLLTSAFASEQKNDSGATTGANAKKAHAVIEKRCTACHSKEKIDSALSSGKDMSVIQKEMEKKGVRLNSNEREVLGIFWKQAKPTANR